MRSAGLPDPTSRSRSKASRDRGPPISAAAAAETPRQIIKEARPGDLGAMRDIAYGSSDGSPMGVAATPRTMIREMPKGSAPMNDPFAAGKTAQQHLNQATATAAQEMISGGEVRRSSGDRQSIESMTPRTAIREAPVGSLGGNKLPAVDSGGMGPQEDAADLLRSFKSKSPYTPPGAAAKASQEIPFHGGKKGKDGGLAPPPIYTMPTKGSPGRVAGAQRKRKGEPQVVSGVPPKPKRDKKNRPLPPSSFRVPITRDSSYESFLRCVNGTLDVFIFLTLLIMGLIFLSVHGDKIPKIELDVPFSKYLPRGSDL